MFAFNQTDFDSPSTTIMHSSLITDKPEAIGSSISFQSEDIFTSDQLTEINLPKVELSDVPTESVSRAELDVIKNENLDSSSNEPIQKIDVPERDISHSDQLTEINPPKFELSDVPTESVSRAELDVIKNENLDSPSNEPFQKTDVPELNIPPSDQSTEINQPTVDILPRDEIEVIEIQNLKDHPKEPVNKIAVPVIVRDIISATMGDDDLVEKSEKRLCHLKSLMKVWKLFDQLAPSLLMQHLLNIMVESEIHLFAEYVKIIIHKAIQEPEKSIECANLCAGIMRLSTVLHPKRSADFTELFTHFLIKNCNNIFDNILCEDSHRNSILLNVFNPQWCMDDIECIPITDSREELIDKRAAAHCRFIGQLYKANIIFNEVDIVNFAKRLANQFNRRTISCVCALIDAVGINGITGSFSTMDSMRRIYWKIVCYTMFFDRDHVPVATRYDVLNFLSNPKPNRPSNPRQNMQNDRVTWDSYNYDINPNNIYLAGDQ